MPGLYAPCVLSVRTRIDRMKDEMSEIARQPYAMVVRSGCVALLLWVDVNPPAVAGSSAKARRGSYRLQISARFQ